MTGNWLLVLLALPTWLWAAERGKALSLFSLGRNITGVEVAGNHITRK
ncbi:MAG: hypothetical protein FJY95_13375 [Candidatus Handelsmanbacteria bacterium]|nr:hypothetical protein [Candidatus Handelsmanbacteria bacterium]